MSTRVNSQTPGKISLDVGRGDHRRSENLSRDIINLLKRAPYQHTTIASKNITGSLNYKTGIPRAAEKKLCSRSLNDLVSTLMDQEENHNGKRRKTSTPSKPKADMLTYSNVLAPTTTTESLDRPSVTDAGRRVQSVLMLHAWRRRREDNKKALATVESLTSQVESLQMQIYVLRKLLENEKCRVAVANEDVRRTLMNLDESRTEKEALIKEKEEMESDLEVLEDEIARLQDKFCNQKNDLMTVKIEAENLQKQVEKEREKINKLEEEKRILREEVQYGESRLLIQTKSLEQLTNCNKELQSKLEAQIPLWEETKTQVETAHKKLKRSEETQKVQEKEIKEKEEKITELRLIIADLERRQQEQDERNGQLSKAVQEKEEQLTVVSKKLGDLMEMQNTWSGRVGQVASVCAKVPIACLYTLVLLLIPRTSFRGF